MKEPIENNGPNSFPNLREHMANERTFLAWIRTIIAIMAFGFVVEKFSLFIKRFSYLLGRTIPNVVPPTVSEYSSMFGIVLVAMGACMALIAFVRYKKVEKEINNNMYRPSLLLDILVTLGIITIGIFLIFYMIHSTKI